MRSSPGWQRAFALAWQEIQANHPAYGPALAAGLTALMPLAAPAPWAVM